MMSLLRSQIPHNEFDYLTLLSALRDYKHPRDRITKLLRQGAIIRIKKGLYVWGENERRGPVHKEVLANLIFGPSYISLEYSLQYHGLIPERVEAVTSVTISRSREFDTPLGRFVYQTIPLRAFRAGVDRVDLGQGRHCLLALPEKALADKLYCDRLPIRSQKGIRTYLFEDLRIEPEVLCSLKLDRLEDYATRYRSQKISLLSKVVRRLKKAGGGHVCA